MCKSMCVSRLCCLIFGSGNGKQGFYGIQTMNFQMNMASTANRAWRSGISPKQLEFLSIPRRLRLRNLRTLYYTFNTGRRTHLTC